MQKNHRKFLEKSIKKTKNLVSDNILDDHEGFDVYQKERDEDDQYDRLLRDANDYKRATPAYDFDEDPLYSGRKITKKDLYEENENILEDESIIEDDDEIESTNGDIRPKKNLESFDINEMIEDINKQDKEVMKNEQNKEEELKKARAVKDQQYLLDHLVEARVKMQDVLKAANRFPHPSVHQKLGMVDKNGQIRSSLNDIQVELIDLIDLIENITVEYESVSSEETVLTKRKRLYKTHLYMKDQKINKQKFDKFYRFDTDKLWQHLNDNFESQLPALDKTITNWAQKFNILSQSSLKGRFANIFQTPVQQAQKAMEDYERLLKRSQIKDLSGKVLFDMTEKSTTQDEEVYNDDDFYMLLFREMLQKQGQSAIQNEEHDGLLIENTRLILKNKLLQAKPKKDVDRRASKNRKIRFEVHQKLINFVAPIDNTDQLPGRDHILKNLFGLNDKVNGEKEDKKEEPVLKKSNKKNRQNVHESIEDDVRLF